MIKRKPPAIPTYMHASHYMKGKTVIELRLVSHKMIVYDQIFREKESERSYLEIMAISEKN